MNKRMKVVRIKEEGGRLLFYENRPHYYVIGSHKTASDVGVGDTILYKPCGGNFGWFEARIPKLHSVKDRSAG